MKIFCTGYYKGLFMLIYPDGTQSFKTRVLMNNKPVFGKLTQAWNNETMSAEEVIEKFPKYKKHYDYLKFLETQVEVLRILNYDGKEIDIYSSNGTWNDVCHHMGHYRRHGNRAYNDAWKMQVAGLNTQEFKKFQNKYKTPKKPKPNRNLSSQK